MAVALAFPGSASAQPSKEELKERIDKAGKDLTVVVEKYNKARENFKASKEKIRKLSKKLKPLEKRVDALYGETGKIASAAYKGGQASAVDALLTSGSPATLADQLSTLGILADKQNKKIDSLNRAKADLDEKRTVIDEVLAKQTKIKNDLAAKKKKISGEVDKLKKTYVKAFGPLNPPTTDYGTPPYVGGQAQKIVNFAYAQLGEPYEFGAAGPGAWDCSGLTLGAYQQVGVSLPHSSGDQYNATARVSRGDLMPGDLVFYYSDLHHVGVYIGGGTVIHAPQPGEYVKKSSVYAMPYAGAGRANY
ncbi:MAG: NlpC/P60 family protein [Micromonosporaceae bacterium]